MNVTRIIKGENIVMINKLYGVYGYWEMLHETQDAKNLSFKKKALPKKKIRRDETFHVRKRD